MPAPVANTRDYRKYLGQLKGAVAQAFQPGIDRVRGVLERHAGADGTIPLRRRNAVVAEAGELVLRLFVGSDGRSAFGDDGVSALAPYPALLNRYYVLVTASAVYTHYRWLKRHADEDIFQALATRGRSVPLEEMASAVRFTALGAAELDLLRIFRQRPFAPLDANRRWVPMHRWTDPSGYQLSDRIWRTGTQTRLRIDALVGEGIAQGRAARDIARDVERFLLPTRAPLRTRKPYGVDASFDAMRLARTEIARAANQATYVSGFMNPYTSGVDVARSANGDRSCPICPQHATIGFAGERLRDPYPFEDAQIPPFHPHDMCHVRIAVVDAPAVRDQWIRAALAAGQEPALTPAQPRNFLRWLLGGALLWLFDEVVGLGLFEV